MTYADAIAAACKIALETGYDATVIQFTDKVTAIPDNFHAVSSDSRHTVNYGTHLIHAEVTKAETRNSPAFCTETVKLSIIRFKKPRVHTTA